MALAALWPTNSRRGLWNTGLHGTGALARRVSLTSRADWYRYRVGVILHEALTEQLPQQSQLMAEGELADLCRAPLNEAPELRPNASQLRARFGLSAAPESASQVRLTSLNAIFIGRDAELAKLRHRIAKKFLHSHVQRECARAQAYMGTMRSSAESPRCLHCHALLTILVGLLACGSEHADSDAAGSGGLSAAGGTGGVGAESSTRTSATAASAAGVGTAAVSGAGGARSTIPDASVVGDDWDSGVRVSDASGASGAPAQPSQPADTAGQRAKGTTVSVKGQVIEAQASGNFTPYAGAKVCVLDSVPAVCTTSDASGTIVLEMPANAQTGITMEQDGLFPMITPITTGTADIDLGSRAGWSNYGAAVVISQETRASLESMLGTKLDMTKGQADMIVLSIASGVVTIPEGSAELKWFRDSVGQTTVTNGPPPLLSVLHGFTNIEPGTVTFRGESNGQPCHWDPMIWAGDQPGTVTVPIRAGWWTRLMEVKCD